MTQMYVWSDVIKENLGRNKNLFMLPLLSYCMSITWHFKTNKRNFNIMINIIIQFKVTI
jgi:hypothetical protein